MSVSLAKPPQPGLVWLLERHAYAPELNRAHVITLKGNRLVALVDMPGVTSLEETERQLKEGGYIA